MYDNWIVGEGIGGKVVKTGMLGIHGPGGTFSSRKCKSGAILTSVCVLDGTATLVAAAKG